MYVDNLYYYGHLVNADDFNPIHLHNDMYELFQNPYVSILGPGKDHVYKIQLFLQRQSYLLRQGGGVNM